MKIILIKYIIRVINEKTRVVILERKRLTVDRMWYLDFSNKINMANSVYKISNKADIIKFLVAAIWNPVLET